MSNYYFMQTTKSSIHSVRKLLGLPKGVHHPQEDNMRLKIIVTIITGTFFTAIYFDGSVQAQDITKIRVVYKIPNMDKVQVQHGVKYRTFNGTGLNMDSYYPPNLKRDTRLPVVIFVLGYSDDVMQKKMGSKLKDIEWYISWGKLTAASGMIAITYETQQPGSDIDELLKYIRQNAASLKINENKIGIWSYSANVPKALSILM